MRWFTWFLTAGLFSTATQVGGQEPAGVIIRNPYFHADVHADVRAVETTVVPSRPIEVRPIESQRIESRPTAAPLSFPVAAAAEVSTRGPLRAVSSGQMMQALRDAVHTEPTKLESKPGVATLAPAPFVPAFDAAPIAASPSNLRYDRAIVTASATTPTSATIPTPAPAPAPQRGLLKDAVDAHLEVTRLSSNPLREAAPVAAPVTLRVANPLR